MPRFLGRTAFTTLGALAVGYSLAKRAGQPRRMRRSSEPEPTFAPFVQAPYVPLRSAVIGLILLLLAGAAGYAAYPARTCASGSNWPRD